MKNLLKAWALWFYPKSLIIGITCLLLTSSIYALDIITDPWIRIGDDIKSLKINSGATKLAYETQAKAGLMLLDTQTLEYFRITPQTINGSYLWSADGFYIFFRELITQKDGSIVSEIKMFNTQSKRTDVIKTITGPTGYLGFGSSAFELQIMSEDGLQLLNVEYKNFKPKNSTQPKNNWVVTNTAVYWLDQGINDLKKVSEKNAEIASFSITTDLKQLAWSNENHDIYYSDQGKPAVYVGKGRDPKWHPFRPFLIYAGARMIGTAVRDFDLKLLDIQHNQQKFLTNTPSTDEAWPEWHPKGDKIFYTKNMTTDIFLMRFAF